MLTTLSDVVIIKEVQFEAFLMIFKLELEVIIDVVHVVLCFKKRQFLY